MSTLTFPRHQRKLRLGQHAASYWSLNSVRSDLNSVRSDPYQWTPGEVRTSSSARHWSADLLHSCSAFDLPSSQLEEYINFLEQRLKEACLGLKFRSVSFTNLSHPDHDKQADPSLKNATWSQNKQALSQPCPVEFIHNLYTIRKADLRELKLLQKLENKQYQDLAMKAQYMREQQDKKFEHEIQTLLRTYEADIEALNKQQKLAVEKEEFQQANESKQHLKRLRQEQERDFKNFKDELKQEMKLLKQEVERLPKDARKEAFRKKKEEKEVEHQEKERKFLEMQQANMEKASKKLTDQHREKMARIERRFLEEKQQLLRAREAAVWELEERHLQERHHLIKRQLKDSFFLKRHQMLTRHEKELEQMKRINTRREEEMMQRHLLEKKRLPKILKNEMKTRLMMFKQSLRISGVNTVEQEREKIRQFEEEEKKRMKAEQLRQDLKHRKQWEDLQQQNNTAIKELEQLQAEKRKLLMESETQKLKELDEKYQAELKDWKAKLRPRKQALEEKFMQQIRDQEKFYSGLLDGRSPSTSSSSPSPPSYDTMYRANKSSRQSTAM